MRHHSRRRCNDHDERPHRRSGCAIKRIVRGLADRFGVSRGAVVASFILGFVFVPMLALLVLAAAWFWVDDQERFEHRVTNVADRARKVYDRTFGSPTPREPDVETVMADPVPDFPHLRKQFENLEARAGAMEAYVSSDDFRLHREFKNI